MLRTSAIFYLLYLSIFSGWGASNKPVPVPNPELKAVLDSFYDPGTNYTEFEGRVTDRDDSNHIFKIHSSNKNTKFFRAGDVLDFAVMEQAKHKRCRAFVRGKELDYFIIYVPSMSTCWNDANALRRGSRLWFNSKQLTERVREASAHRLTLMQRREDFLQQLNGINHFIWGFEQIRGQTLADYEKRILQLEQEKQQAISELSDKREDQMRLQQELAKRLDELDQDLEFYRVEKIPEPN